MGDEPSGSHVAFRVRGKTFAWYHGDGRRAINAKAPPGQNEELGREQPERCFIPSYLGPRGWVGLRVDLADTDWEQLESVVVHSYLLVAPKRLGAELLRGAET
ncbi:MAG: MmcQ/YjbR family DNA-binding protein [Solirubrobacterales bacterium]|nr:MmcQ/YjbR family DNA-binding protein [Solirubrobacterales bacterium]